MENITIKSELFGVLDGREITKYTLSNEQIKLSVINYGCIITNLSVLDKFGEFRDIVLGYDTIDDYKLNPAYMGALVGRYANRIKGSKFMLNGEEIVLTPNEGDNHLHGVLEHTAFETTVGENNIRFTYVSPDGEEGYPGQVQFSIVYTLYKDSFSIDYGAESDKDTVLNLTNHSYFCLNGHGNGSIDSHSLQIRSSRILEIDEELCPTGGITDCKGTKWDFTSLKLIGNNDYDNCYILDKSDDCNVLLYSEESGITMKVTTTLPGVQIYTADFMGDIPSAKDNKTYHNRSGVAVETQYFPNSVNIPSFPSTVLKAKEKYKERTTYTFSHN